jgi:hypothetical protein
MIGESRRRDRRGRDRAAVHGTDRGQQTQQSTRGCDQGGQHGEFWLRFLRKAPRRLREAAVPRRSQEKVPARLLLVVAGLGLSGALPWSWRRRRSRWTTAARRRSSAMGAQRPTLGRARLPRTRRSMMGSGGRGAKSAMVRCAGPCAGEVPRHLAAARARSCCLASVHARPRYLAAARARSWCLGVRARPRYLAAARARSWCLGVRTRPSASAQGRGIAALGVSVWLGVTVAARSRRRSAGCPARRTTSRSRRFVLRRSASSPTQRSAFRSSALLAVPVEAALSRLPGTALDSLVWRCHWRSGRAGAWPGPRRCARPHGLWALRSPCPSRRHSAGSSSRRSAFRSGAALSVPVEAALDDPVGHCAG